MTTFRMALGIAVVVGLTLLVACTCGERDKPAADNQAAPAVDANAAKPDADADQPEAEKLPPPPVDPLARDEWLKEAAARMPVPSADLQMGPDGVSVFTACMSEDDLRAQTGVRLCPDTAITSDERCYTTFLNPTREDLPLELWVRGDKLARAVSRSNRFVSPQSVGVGEHLLRLSQVYKSLHFLRGDKNEWIAAVEPLNTQFVLDNTTAKSVEEMDPFTPIIRMETIFDCKAARPNK